MKITCNFREKMHIKNSHGIKPWESVKENKYEENIKYVNTAGPRAGIRCSSPAGLTDQIFLPVARR